MSAPDFTRATAAFREGDFDALLQLAVGTPEGPPPDVTARRDNRRQRPKGYYNWRPQQPARVLIDQVRDVLEEYVDHLPLTVRQIFYRLVATAGYPKDENAYSRLAEMLVKARRARMIPFDAIRDDGVVTIPNRWYGGIEDFHDESARRARSYRRDRQDGQPVRIELWCEAAGMLGQLERVAQHYSVPVYSTGGFGSLTANYEIAERALDRLVPTVLLHVGDFDPSGESIFTAMSQDVAAFVRADRIIETLAIEPVRVALTADQVAAFNLPTARSAKWQGGTCQLEALAPDELAEIVRAEIENRIDFEIFESVLAQERDDRAELLALPPGASS